MVGGAAAADDAADAAVRAGLDEHRSDHGERRLVRRRRHQRLPRPGHHDARRASTRRRCSRTRSVANDVDVIANQTNPNTLRPAASPSSTITDPVVALQGSGTGRRAVPRSQPRHDAARQHHGRLQPARHRRVDRQRCPAGRAAVPGRRERQLHERPGRLRRRRDDRAEPRDARHAGERTLPARRRQPAARPDPRYHDRTPSAATNGSASTTSPSRLHGRRGAGRRSPRRRRTARRTSPLDSNIDDHLQRARERRRLVVHDLLRDERCAHGRA